MATPAGDPVFVDTNVLVFANVKQASQHAAALAKLRSLRAAGSELWISCQVLREFLAVRSRADLFPEDSSAAMLVERICYFQSRFRVAAETAHVTKRLLALIQQTAVSGRQVHDANIVATMLVHDIHFLLTDNVGDFTRYSALITVLPLVAAPNPTPAT
jgi:predicted nucleic acid-binding protein